MRKSRKRNNKGRRLFFTVMMLFIVLCAGYLLKGKMSFFFDRIIAGPITEDRDDVENKDNPINISTNKGDIGSNINDNKNNNFDYIENNQNSENQDTNDNDNYNKDSDSKQPVQNADDILVLVNKERYLDSDYKPNDLVVPDVRFSFDGEHEKKHMRKEAAEALERLFGQAQEEGIYIFALSGYRSYNTQKWLFENKANKVGEEAANKLVARPGESEHQTGLAMDITSQSVQFDLKEEFSETEEGRWVRDNAHKFGFIIRFTKDKEHVTGYNYEPWHLRYVGKKAAGEIYNKGIVLEEYFK